MVDVINATPPADFPEQVVIMDRNLAKRHPEAGFYLRISRPGGDVNTITLKDAVSVSYARTMARQMGYEPTHWVEIHEDGKDASGPFRYH